ncbi:MAG: hypothetical protein ACOC08_03840 [Campylobacterales bacterium]
MTDYSNLFVAKVEKVNSEDMSSIVPIMQIVSFLKTSKFQQKRDAR